MSTHIEDFSSMRVNEIAAVFDNLSRQRISQIIQIFVKEDDIDTLWKLYEAKKVLKKVRNERRRLMLKQKASQE